MSSWRHGVTRYQWLVLFVAWLGWVFDAMDATIYAIVLYPALHELLGVNGAGASAQDIGWYGGIIFSIFLIGWAVGGIVFGVLADRFGRTRILIATILVYAVFTGAAAPLKTMPSKVLSFDRVNARRSRFDMLLRTPSFVISMMRSAQYSGVPASPARRRSARPWRQPGTSRECAFARSIPAADAGRDGEVGEGHPGSGDSGKLVKRIE